LSAGGVHGTRLLLSLFVAELAALLAAMALCRRGDRSLQAFLTAPSGLGLAVAVLLLVGATLLVVREIYRLRAGPRRLVATIALNLWAVILAFGGAEAVVRVFAIDTPEGLVFASASLPPKSWERVAARNRAVWQQASARGSYLVYDPELGWTVGPSRRSGDYNAAFVRRYLADLGRPLPPQYARENPSTDGDGAIYLSSLEGLRSPRVGMSFAGAPARRRVAIVGDSFTFGLEVPYDQTWGNQLELLLGPGVQVLNFGVDGYGVDQAFLRYQRDVAPWHPDVAILSVIDDDLRRTMGVYAFLSFPSAEMPFPKPRYTMRGSKLTLLNAPLPRPDDIFSKASITDLPFIDEDASFERCEWEWRPYHAAYAVRFLLSRCAARSRPPLAETLKAVNAELLRSFITLAQARGAVPLVVLLPSSSAFAPGYRSIGKDVLQGHQIPHLDLTDCVGRVPPAERFVALHYSGRTNAAVAKCLRKSVGALPALATSGR
jgi:hypothetical protein